MRTPTSTWPSKRMRSGATRKVGGLPTSCSSAPQARVRGASGGSCSSSSSVCTQTSPSGWNCGGCSTPFMRATSGSTSRSRPVSSSSSKARRAWPSVSILVSSSRTRSRLTCVNARRQRADGREGFRLDAVAEARGEAHGAQHAQLVFVEAALGIADGADDAGLEIVAAADVVEDAIAVQRIQQQAVDGEVAALDVLLRALWCSDLVGMAAVGVGAVGAEGGDLDVVRVLGRNGAGEGSSGCPTQSSCAWLGVFNGTSTTPNCAPTA